jgi:hypothetical protein
MKYYLIVMKKAKLTHATLGNIIFSERSQIPGNGKNTILFVRIVQNQPTNKTESRFAVALG